jgi:hypothetical protein
MNWVYQGSELIKRPLRSIGFVYKITNIQTGEFYIGKKHFLSNKKNYKGFVVTKESDWRDYWGSSKYLKEVIDNLGKEHFKREILRLCENRDELSYWETKYQFMLGVLERETAYNKSIMGKFFKDDKII